jgi:peptidoglycan/xylan/chitin deacetylase (PgdA/CDA1 family)
LETKIKIVALFLSIAIVGHAQSGEWKGKKCAVVLTYDDALNVHLDNAIPALDSVGLKGTFYLSVYSPGCSKRIEDWRKAAARGHELANHTLYHPCNSNKPGRSWVTPDQALEKYSMARIVKEIRMTNVFLEAIDGKTKRTFAYPCGEKSVGDSSYVDKIKSDFIAARGVTKEMATSKTIDYYNVGAYGISGESGQQLIAIVKEAMAKNMLVVFLFHGVGGEHGANVDLKAHSQLVHFLKEHQKEIWTTTFLEVTEHMKAR